MTYQPTECEIAEAYLWITPEEEESYRESERENQRQVELMKKSIIKEFWRYAYKRIERELSEFMYWWIKWVVEELPRNWKDKWWREMELQRFESSRLEVYWDSSHNSWTDTSEGTWYIPLKWKFIVVYFTD